MRSTTIALTILVTIGPTVSAPIPYRAVSSAGPSTVAASGNDVNNSAALSAMEMPLPRMYGGKTPAPTSHRKRVLPAAAIVEGVKDLEGAAKGAKEGQSWWQKASDVVNKASMFTFPLSFFQPSGSSGSGNSQSGSSSSSSHGSGGGSGSDGGGGSSGGFGSSSGGSGGSSGGFGSSSGGSGGGSSGGSHGSVGRRDESTESLANLIHAIHSRADSEDQIDPLVEMSARSFESEALSINNLD
ncbi:hypothetical protein BC835DRAFT_1310306 [Cytidiella melzeri]|nr:hypothetical protein BC835DRAFT_1310306 [Cytidiella melzeri]